MSDKNNVIEFPAPQEPFSYEVKGEKITGVIWERDGERVTFDFDGVVEISGMDDTFWIGLPPEELKQLMIMWLAIFSPECLSFDD